jgi:hypothetical protein
MSPDVRRALCTVRGLARHFATVTDDDLNRSGWDDPAVRAEALAEAERRGLLRRREGRRASYTSTTFEGEL